MVVLIALFLEMKHVDAQVGHRAARRSYTEHSTKIAEANKSWANPQRQPHRRSIVALDPRHGHRKLRVCVLEPGCNGEHLRLFNVGFRKSLPHTFCKTGIDKKGFKYL